MAPLAAIAILSALGIGGSALKGGLELWLNNKLGRKQIDLQTMLAQNEATTAKLSNEENRRQSEQFMTMYQTDKAEGRKEKTKDRQMQLLGAMLSSMGQMRQTAVDTQVAVNRPLPPTSLTSLIRGQ